MTRVGGGEVPYINFDCRLQLVMDSRCGPLHSFGTTLQLLHGRLGGVTLAVTLLVVEVNGPCINVSCKLKAVDSCRLQSFLGALASSRLSVRPHLTTRFPLDGIFFYGIWCLRIVIKSADKVTLKSDRNNGHHT